MSLITGGRLVSRNILSSRRLYRLYRLFIEPKSNNEDSKRREFVLNVLLSGLVVLSLAAFGKAFTDFLLDPTYVGFPLILLGFITVIFGGLFLMSRLGWHKIASYVFISLMIIVATYPLYAWGIGLSQGLLIYALIIVMSGILIGNRFGVIVAAFLSVVLIILTYLQVNRIVIPDTYWKDDTGGMSDAIVYVFTFGVITSVSWLFNREIRKSLIRAKRSEAALRRERNSLEVKVVQRTKQLQQAQVDKMIGLYRFVELGRLSSGLMHDMINPLTAVSINLEQLSTKERSHVLTQAVKGIKQIENFVDSARKQVQGQQELVRFSVLKETSQALNILASKAREHNIKLKLVKTGSNWALFGDRIKFYQAILNIVSNAIDAYENSHYKNKKVQVNLTRELKAIRIIVHNWGEPIPKADLDKIFEPFFTTKKPGKGIGIGLVITKKIIEEDFFGQIKVTSSRKSGTRFIVRLPLLPPRK